MVTQWWSLSPHSRTSLCLNPRAGGFLWESACSLCVCVGLLWVSCGFPLLAKDIYDKLRVCWIIISALLKYLNIPKIALHLPQQSKGRGVVYLNGMVKECKRNGKSLSSIALCLTVHCGLVLFFPAIFFLLLLFLGGFICTMTAKDSQETGRERLTFSKGPPLLGYPTKLTNYVHIVLLRTIFFQE